MVVCASASSATRSSRSPTTRDCSGGCAGACCACRAAVLDDGGASALVTRPSLPEPVTPETSMPLSRRCAELMAAPGARRHWSRAEWRCPRASRLRSRRGLCFRLWELRFSARSGSSFGFRGCAPARPWGKELANSDGRAFGGRRSRRARRLRRGDFDGDLVSLKFDERLVLAHAVAAFFIPLGDGASLTLSPREHYDIGHDFTLAGSSWLGAPADRLGPENMVVAVVLLNDGDLRGIEAAHQARVDANLRASVRRRRSNARTAAGFAMVHFQHAVAPHVDDVSGVAAKFTSRCG